MKKFTTTILRFVLICFLGYPATRGFSKWFCYGTPLIDFFHRVELQLASFALAATGMAFVWMLLISLSTAVWYRKSVCVLLCFGLALFLLQDYSPMGSTKEAQTVLDGLVPGMTWNQVKDMVPRRLRAEGNRKIDVESFDDFYYRRAIAKRCFLSNESGSVRSFFPLSFRGKGIPITATNEMPYLGYVELLFDRQDRFAGVSLHSAYFEPTTGGTLADNWTPCWTFVNPVESDGTIQSPVLTVGMVRERLSDVFPRPSDIHLFGEEMLDMVKDGFLTDSSDKNDISMFNGMSAGSNSRLASLFERLTFSRKTKKIEPVFEPMMKINGQRSEGLLIKWNTDRIQSGLIVLSEEPEVNCFPDAIPLENNVMFLPDMTLLSGCSDRL